MFEHYQLLVFMGGIAILLGLASGIYPALFLAGFHPLGNLNGHFSSPLKGLLLRKVLVICQFAIAMILMIATLVLYLQVNFMQNQALGFKKEQQLVVGFQFDERVLNQQATIKQTLQSVAGVDNVSFSSCIPGRVYHTYPTQLENAQKVMQDFQANVYFVDEEFLSQYEIKVIVGRDFSPQIASDMKQAILINEAAAFQLGFLTLSDALGKKFNQLGFKGNIIGVVKDFHYHSYESKIQPLILRMAPGFFTFMSIKVSSQSMQQVIEEVKEKWGQLLPEIPLVYFFADEAYDAQYKAEERFGSLFVYLTIMAILVSCLGLFGLSVMNTSGRVKEIGVRKILGASGSNLYVLLSKENIKLIVISMLIAIPIANYFTSEWLNKFAYRITIPYWAFIIPAIMLFSISLLTIGSQTVKTIRKNPVDSLRHE
ncbi:FtsX-like permease family protein [Catalinimonas sp. 4WD22]|uniref:ABC transporter permease n=1 Tax=Catalinimonas locisalis TaxID=3133978 RepID=UPI0031012083